MEERVRCEHCGEVIGVYEPMVVIVDGEPVHGSRASTRIDLQGLPRFHGACFNRIRTVAEPPAS
jgi:hypothetical protein